MGSVMSYALGLAPERPSPAGLLIHAGFLPTVEGWAPDLAGRDLADRTSDVDRLQKYLEVPAVLVRLLLPVAALFAFHLFMRGHNQPGGGFVGGLVAGAAISLRYIAGGIVEVRRISRWRPWTILGTGVIVAVGTAMAPVALGYSVLQAGYRPIDVPVLGRVAAGGRLAILVKRCDRLDNLQSLASTPKNFRETKLAEVEAALPIWRRIDSQGATLIESLLASLRSSDPSDLL